MLIDTIRASLLIVQKLIVSLGTTLGGYLLGKNNKSSFKCSYLNE